MIKDYVKHKSKNQRQTRKTMAGLLLLLGVALVSGFSFYVYKKSDLSIASIKETVVLKMAAYFPHALNKQKKEPPSKKSALNTPEAAKPIHFAFYDELPKAQLEFSQKQSQEEEEAPAAAKAVELAEVKASNSVSTAATSSKALNSGFSEKDIEQDLYEDLSSMKAAESTSPYILQIGVFHNIEAANRYRSALQSAGLKVDVVRAKVGKEMVYRLQQGPYYNLEQLKSAKKRLTERGVTCDIRKLPQYDT